MKADLISIQAALLGMAVLLSFFLVRWLAAGRRCDRRRKKAATLKRTADRPKEARDLP